MSWRFEKCEDPGFAADAEGDGKAVFEIDASRDSDGRCGVLPAEAAELGMGLRIRYGQLILPVTEYQAVMAENPLDSDKGIL